MAKKKRVYASFVETSDYNMFENTLTNYSKVISINNKAIEIAGVSSTEEHISGVFVSTLQKADIAPQHEPGVANDYSEIKIDDNKGLAYPNAFIYIKDLRVLLWEVNSAGISESRLKKFFQEIYSKKTIKSISCDFLPILNMDSYNRIMKMTRIASIKMSIANPNNVLSRKAPLSWFMGIAKNIGQKTGASKKITIRLDADSDDTLNPKDIKEIIAESASLNKENTSFTSINCQVKGEFLSDDKSMIEETVNLVIDRVTDYFELDNTENSDIWIFERKQAMFNIAKNLYPKLQKILNED